MTEPAPTFAELCLRYTEDPDDPPDVTVITFAEAIGQGDDCLHIISYLAGLGVRVTSLADLEPGINGLEDEEELYAHRVSEGVAVSHQSDGWWALFV